MLPLGNGYGIIVKSNNQGGYYLQMIDLLTKEPINNFATAKEYVKFIRKNRGSIDFTIWGTDDSINHDLMYKIRKDLEKYPDIILPINLAQNKGGSYE